jgi:hypothetical protein
MSTREMHHVRLDADGRDARSKISDAITDLRAGAKFGEHDMATICVGVLRLPSVHEVGLVEVLFEAPWVDTIYRVPLRTAARFFGRLKNAGKDSGKKVNHDIIRLNRAKVDSRGTVTLADGTVLFAVEVSTAPEMTHPTELDWRIVHASLKVIPGGEHCYQSPAEGAPFAIPEVVANERVLDCHSLRFLRPPPLKDIIAGVRRADPSLTKEKASNQKIADALRKFGLRVPTPRPRVSKMKTRAKA